MPAKMNVLELKNPDDWGCGFFFYTQGHSELMLVLNQLSVQPSKRIYVSFQHVRYFSGSFTWRGANIVQESDEDCLQFLDTLAENKQNVSTQDLMSIYNYRLYSLAPYPIEQFNDSIRASWKLFASEPCLLHEPNGGLIEAHEIP